MSLVSYAPMTGAPLADLLAAAADARRIVLTGPYPPATELRRWLGAVPGTVHYCRSDGRCLMTTAVGVRVSSLAAWTPEPMSASGARGLMYRLATMLRARFDIDLVPLVSPAVCGMALYRAICGDIPPLAPELQSLIRQTSPQRRDEPCLVLPKLSALPAVQCWDGQFMYGALLGDLPGPFLACRPFAPGEALPGSFRGRVTAKFRVPEWWQHVGLLPRLGSRGKGWEFPCQPGEEGEGWFEACELRYAISQGWHVQLREGIQFATADPLGPWAGRLLRLWRAWETKDPQLARCLRAIVLQTVGDFQGRARRNERVFTDARTGLEIERETLLPMGAARESLAHPEWCAAVWGRCRLRVAKWLMAVPREQVLRVATDAVYLSGPLPWEGVGPGHPRLKRVIAGPLPAPHTKRAWVDLLGREEGHDETMA